MSAESPQNIQHLIQHLKPMCSNAFRKHFRSLQKDAILLYEVLPSSVFTRQPPPQIHGRTVRYSVIVRHTSVRALDFTSIFHVGTITAKFDFSRTFVLHHAQGSTRNIKNIGHRQDSTSSNRFLLIGYLSHRRRRRTVNHKYKAHRHPDVHVADHPEIQNAPHLKPSLRLPAKGDQASLALWLACPGPFPTSDG